MKTVLLIIRVVLAAVFMAAGFAKLGDLDGFAAALQRFEVLPGGGLAWVARYLPWFEVAAGAALLTPQLFRGAWWLLVGFVVVATAVLAQAYFRGLDVDCGCWGAWLEMPLPWAIVRNAVLLALLGLVCLSPPHPKH